jgi:hypothetical protein
MTALVFPLTLAPQTNQEGSTVLLGKASPTFPELPQKPQGPNHPQAPGCGWAALSILHLSLGKA